jgi:hypothetical protein
MNKGSPKLLAGAASLIMVSCLLQSLPAKAQPRGLSGSYLGVTVDPKDALGLGQDYLQQPGSTPQWFVDRALEGTQPTATTGSNPQTETLDGKAFQGRIDLNNSPLSIRGKVALNSETSVVQPIVSYDLAIARNMNFYAGAGYSFVTSQSNSQSPDHQNSFFVTAGAEAAVNDKVVVYGDAQYPLNQAQFNLASPVKVQLGIGFRF